MSWQPPNPPQAPNKQPQVQTFYTLLQVDPQAHPTIIRYAYRFLAGVYHPDNVESGNPEMFRVVSEAFRTLSDAGKRAAYDAQLGVQAPQPQQQPQPGQWGQSSTHSGKIPVIPKTGISYSEVELRLAVLQILLTQRKKKVQSGGASAKMLMDILNVEMAEMEFILWYLREKGWIIRNEASFQISVQGVDYLVDSMAKTQAIDDGGKTPTPSGVQLPATIG